MDLCDVAFCERCSPCKCNHPDDDVVVLSSKQSFLILGRSTYASVLSCRVKKLMHERDPAVQIRQSSRMPTNFRFLFLNSHTRTVDAMDATFIILSFPFSSEKICVDPLSFLSLSWRCLVSNVAWSEKDIQRIFSNMDGMLTMCNQMIHSIWKRVQPLNVKRRGFDKVCHNPTSLS